MGNGAKWALAFGLGVAVIGLGAAQAADKLKNPPMTFFVTSVGSGKGADLGGLAGADKHCMALARAAKAKKRKWRAYLSADAVGKAPAVNARDRIGKGPWRNAKGVLIAQDLTALHVDAVNINKETALTETGAKVNGRGDTPNVHDILTGSKADGTLAAGATNLTCSNWTSSGEGSATVGHHDRASLQPGLSPWNSAHPSRGCSQANLQGTGGNGLFYCFAVK